MNPLQYIANLIGGAGLLGGAIMVGRAYQMLRDVRAELKELRLVQRHSDDRLARLETAFIGVDHEQRRTL